MHTPEWDTLRIILGPVFQAQPELASAWTAQCCDRISISVLKPETQPACFKCKQPLAITEVRREDMAGQGK